MIWYSWKVWRFAWSLNACREIKCSSGRWLSLCGTRLMLRVAAIMLAIVLLASSATACERCGLFGNRCAFKQVQAVVQHQAYVQPYAVNYFVGAPIRFEALVTKALREDPDYQEFQKFRAWKSVASGLEVAPSLPLTGEPDLLIKHKCASCHAGDKAAGDIVLDGSMAVSDATYRSFSRMFVLGADVPPKMKPLLGELKDAEGSAILAELLKLEPPGELR